MKIIDLESYNLDEKNLLKFGFEKENGELFFSKNILNNDFRVEFKITNLKLEIEVYDNDFNGVYTLFSIDNASGEIVITIREKVDEMLKKLLSISKNEKKIYDELLKYVEEKYKSTTVKPFKTYSDIYALVTPKNKWYALFLDVEYNKLNKDSLLTDNVKIVNLKHDPKSLSEIIDNKNIFPAYHMNKKHWISVILDGNIDFECLKKLIDKSYELVNKK